MKLDKIANIGNDEFYTPAYTILPLIPYLKDDTTVWSPFDTESSLFVKILRLCGFKVIATHIFSGIDFFDCEVPKCDYIISNPPYSLKTEVLLRLFSLDKPFAMLVGVAGLFESQIRFKMFRDNVF